MGADDLEELETKMQEVLYRVQARRATVLEEKRLRGLAQPARHNAQVNITELGQVPPPESRHVLESWPRH